MIVMLSAIKENWDEADNALNVIEISLYRACDDLSYIFNRIRQLATQIIQSQQLQFCNKCETSKVKLYHIDMIYI